jgi:diguanylate cyclase (GGDEF)-like protein
MAKLRKTSRADEVARLQADLAAARARIRKLEATAYVDVLTGVLNRRGFDRELARALAYVQRYKGQAALIYLDLDQFKSCNDVHGHPAGDALLKAVARALVDDVRASDVVARLGGDEFAVLMWNVDVTRAKMRARDLEEAVKNSRVGRGGAVCIAGASAGTTMLRPDASSAQIIALADQAMYLRKRQRRKRSGGPPVRR